MKRNILLMIIFCAMLIFTASSLGCQRTQTAETPATTPTKVITPKSVPERTPVPEEECIVTVSGSTSVEKIGLATMDEFKIIYPEADLSYIGIGSSAGVKNVNEGVTQIGTVSRELKPEEIEYGMTQTLIGYEAIAIVTHKDVTVDNITLEQLKRIYMGDITNWNELGGEDAEIVVWNREDGSGTRGAFHEIAGLTDEQVEWAIKNYENINTCEASGGLGACVGANPNSIGYMSSYYAYGYSEGDWNVVYLDGVELNNENVRAGLYPVVRPYYFVYHPENLSYMAHEYIDFVLSEEGQVIVEEKGLVPIR